MLRRLIGYAAIAVVALVMLKVAFGLFGVLIGLVATLAAWGAIGYVCYLGLKVLSPTTAASIREWITGKPNPRVPPPASTPSPR